jgi:hypothetical protein
LGTTWGPHACTEAYERGSRQLAKGISQILKWRRWLDEPHLRPESGPERTWVERYHWQFTWLAADRPSTHRSADDRDQITHLVRPTHLVTVAQAHRRRAGSERGMVTERPTSWEFPSVKGSLSACREVLTEPVAGADSAGQGIQPRYASRPSLAHSTVAVPDSGSRTEEGGELAGWSVPCGWLILA